MFKPTWIEFFLRCIPETIIFIYGMSVFTRKTFSTVKYILLSLVLAILFFSVRYLPIYFGIHTEICIILTISVMFAVGIPLLKAVQGTFLICFLLSISEAANIMILDKLNLNMDINTLEPLIKCLYGIPSLIFLSLFIVTIDYILKIKERTKNNFN